MNVHKVYVKYLTPKNLQEHMLRVAALSKIITDNWKGSSIDKSAIIKACLIHDITKPISFDLKKQASYGMSSEQIIALEGFQNLVKTKYGMEEHRAVVELGRDIGLETNAVNVLDNLEWKFIPRLIKELNFNALVAIYCDMRIGPGGILSINKRVNNLEERRGGTRDFEYEEFRSDGKILEQKLQKNVSLDLNSITDEDLNSLFEELRNLKL